MRNFNRAPFLLPPTLGTSPKKPSRLLTAIIIAAGGLCVWLMTAGCGGEPGSWARDRGNLLTGLTPLFADGTPGYGQLTDGVTVDEGAGWNVSQAAVLPSDAITIDIDLGATRSIRSIVLQADNNDFYHVEIAAEAGGSFTTIWSAAPVDQPGLRTRSADGLSGAGRIVRIRAAGGDGAYSVAELAIYAETPSPWPPAVSLSPEVTAQWWVMAWGLAMVVWIVFNRQSGRPWRHLALVPAALTLLGAVLAVARLWPLSGHNEAFIRAALAAAAGALVVWDAFAPARRSPDPRFSAAALAVLCLFGVAAFYHFGASQFRYQSQARGTFVHPWDLRNYYPVAKYFPELRYDGVYAASLAAYLDNHPELDESAIADTRLRDLTDNRMVRAAEVMPRLPEVRARFSPERWESFRRDMAELEAMMGAADYLGSLTDHGGNATPAWVTLAYALWRWTPLDETILTLTALIDPLLLALLFIVIARVYGLRAMLIALVIFGTTDFSRFGSNLVGSTLRYDWIAALGLGACALKSKRWVLGGALVAWAGVIRGFPAAAALFLAVPAGYWLVRKLRADRRLPGLTALARENSPVLRAAAGALLCVVFWFVVPVALFSYEGSWGAWINKIAIHMDKPNVNHVGLKNLAGYDPNLTAEKVIRPDLPEPWTDWQKWQLHTREARAPLFLAATLFFTALAVFAARRARLDQAVLLGMFLVPIFFYPANYYLHYLFLLPLAAAGGAADDKRPLAFQAVVVCAVSVAQYATLATPWTDICYTEQSALLLAAWTLMLGALAWNAWDRPVPWKLREWRARQ